MLWVRDTDMPTPMVKIGMYLVSCFIEGFCVLVAHSIHDEVPSYKTPGVYVKNLVVPQVPKVPLTQADVVKFADHVMHFVSTVYDRSHFTVLLFHLEARHVTVYNGLPCDLKKWENHISYILRKYGLQDYKDMPKTCDYRHRW